MKADAVAQVVGPAVAQCGLEVDRIETMIAGKRAVLRVFLDGDGPAGRGPSLDEIADATRAISNALDASDVTGERPYVLEVSSRGVGRPLTDPKHYRRNQGRLVELALLAGGSVTGRVQASDEAGVTLEVAGAERAVAYAEVARAVVQAELTKGDDEDDEIVDEEQE